MIIKAIIQTIDYTSNTCTVRMPLFESTSKGEEVVANATFCNQPGIYNGYKVNDVVFVSFENNELTDPVVIGKLYLGVTSESQDPRGTVNCVDFVSNNSVSIPLSSIINSTANDSVQVQGNFSEYKTINDLINTIQKQAQEIAELKDRVATLEKNKFNKKIS